MRENELASSINIMRADRIGEVYKKTIITYSGTQNEVEIQKKLEEWADAGYIEIIKPISQCESMEKCIKLISRIPLNS